jgi:hypothetical protein
VKVGNSHQSPNGARCKSQGHRPKKVHRDKNLVIVNARSKPVSHLSPTVAGNTHDQKVADQQKIAYPRHAVLHKDTGFQGSEPHVKQTQQPKKSFAATG